MATTAQLLDRLERTFGVGTERLIAISLLDFLAAHAGTSHINLQLVRQLTPQAESGNLDHVILRTLQFLAGDAIGILDTRFEIFDEDQHPHGLEKSMVKEALSSQINPLTGDADPEVSRKIYMFFTPVPEALSLLSELPR
ncbi:hypothetical protein [Polaromonas sp. JS666]|uniref:hypothetical protein n=1 Tax=Polaromonas sp. (strain JS666 / ATCC BAA-500) TaxID=296591 RepID=UPI001113692D|nr:hypothetical protein [Polaromonas sp. JS666]